MTKTLSEYRNDRIVAGWLISVAAVIFCMILLGGATRLTHSGLSMVDWKPIMGVIPPLSEADWLTTFEQYKQFPEYQKINRGMSLSDFKSIFYFEYFHRLLGRAIGLIFLIPFLVFWARGIIRKPLLPQMILLFILGGAQGLLGWYMVKSGLVNNPFVSQYRLTAHLITAVIIYGYLLWIAFGLLSKHSSTPTPPNQGLYCWSLFFTGLITLMIATGGFVAGTKAGLTYNTFPLMEGRLIPEGMYSMQPFWVNWLENVTTIQFNHRLLAYILFFTLPVWALAIRRNGQTSSSRNAGHVLIIVLLLQVSLGIATLLLRVPPTLGVLHQGGAIVLFTVALFITREMKPLRPTSPHPNYSDRH